MTASHRANKTDCFTIHADMLYPGGGRPALADQVITIDDGLIVGLDRAGSRRADASFDIVAPGFVDLQINGAGGCLFNDTPDMETIARMVDASRLGGTCHLLPTYITAQGTGYRDALAAVAAWSGPEVLGVHLEGPFLSPEKPGIHPPAHIRPMDEEDMALLLEHRGRILLTLAPEQVDAPPIDRRAAAGGVRFCGPTNPGAPILGAAVPQGLR
ncbi:MAG: hypothetical protein ACON31_10270, partial [Candidatus Puniceispirillaceae bacterium]